MKLEEKNLARKLRQNGRSINDIYRKLHVAKSSVSLWVRDIELNEKQRQKLSRNGIKKEVVERRRSTRLKRENVHRQNIVDKTKADIGAIDLHELRLIGIALYWAEGGKTQRSLVRFSNSDPNLIRIMMDFFRGICKVPEDKFRGYIHIHPHLDFQKAEKYWSDVSGILVTHFFKTYRKPNKASKNKKDNLPFGTFDIYICDTKLFLTIKGWTEGLCDSVLGIKVAVSSK